MTTYTNTQAVTNKVALAKRASLGGLVLMLPGLIIALGGLANPILTSGEYIAISYLSLIVGTLVATYGGRMAERWLIEPRDDQRLEKALKGLDKRYRLINYYTPADHVLLTPTGLYVVVTKDETGLVTFDGKRWAQPFSLRRLWQDWRHGGLGNPTAEAAAQIAKLQRWLKPDGEGTDAPIKPLIVFTKPEVDLQLADGDEHIMPIKNLKAYLLKHTTPALPSAIYRALADAIMPDAEGTPSEDDADADAEPSAPPPAAKKGRRKKRREKNAEEA